MADVPEVARAIVPQHAAAIREVLAEMAKPAYLELLGKGVGTGIAVGILARRIPALGLPLALAGGIYIGMEMAAYIADEERKEQLGPWIDTREIDDGAE